MGGQRRFAVRIPGVAEYRERIRCQAACPVGTDARGYVRAIAAGDYERAYWIARAPNPLASICGRVCGAPCEAACRRGLLDRPVAIRALKRTATERFGPESGRRSPLELLRGLLEESSARHANQGEEEIGSLRDRLGGLVPGAAAPEQARRVAIVGGGPAGLACAHDLALLGHRPVVFDAEREPAGMLVVGIPEYRLPRELVRAEVEVIAALGVEFRCGTRVGEDVAFDELLQTFDAAVIAIGAKNSRRLELPGIHGPGVLGGVEFLRAVALHEPVPELGRRVVVIGGGNVAYDVARTAVRQVGIDVARTALRQGVASVTLVSLESLEEMPADDVEILEGEQEGVRRLNSLGPLEVCRDEQGRVCSVRFQRCLGVFDEEGRFAPRFDPEDIVEVPCDTVLLAIGQAMDTSFLDPARHGVELTPRGGFVVDPQTGQTTREGVFVAGDAAYGPRLLIHAVASGKRVARAVHRHLTGVDVTPEVVGLHRAIPGYTREPGYETIPRQEPPRPGPAERLTGQDRPVELAFPDEVARREASRCLDCGVNPVFDGRRCILCGGCVEVCPECCLKIVPVQALADTGPLQRLRAGLFGSTRATASAILKDEDLCIRCGLCAERCPNHAIEMERFTFACAPSLETVTA